MPLLDYESEWLKKLKEERPDLETESVKEGLGAYREYYTANPDAHLPTPTVDELSEVGERRIKERRCPADDIEELFKKDGIEGIIRERSFCYN